MVPGTLPSRTVAIVQYFPMVLPTVPVRFYGAVILLEIKQQGRFVDTELNIIAQTRVIYSPAFKSVLSHM